MVISDADPETLDVYTKSANQYQNFLGPGPELNFLEKFTKKLKSEARILDLGCGTGYYADKMRDSGFSVECWDATPEMVKIAKNTYGLNAQVARFSDLSDEGIYDGIWANFSLLHAPRNHMPSLLSAIHKALKPQGIVHIALKLGKGESRDRLGRFYAYYNEREILQLLANAGFEVIQKSKGRSKGLAGTLDPWIILLGSAI